MAKKKKPAANPARGFATTSIASKPKQERQTDHVLDQGMSESVAEDSAPVVQTAAQLSSSTPTGPTDIIQTSEELEAQLERDELQLLVEKYAAKVRRDAHRHVAKFQTERRVLRGQSHAISVYDWLPGDILDSIVSLAQFESNDSNRRQGQQPLLKLLTEEEAMSKLWTLDLTLRDFGFEYDHIQSVLKWLCANAASIDTASSIWGLQEALEWLALDHCEGHVFDYEEFRPKRSAGDSSDPSRPTTPLVLDVTEETDAANPLAPEILKAQIQEMPLPNGTAHTDSDSGDHFVSDLDSDMDSDSLVPTFLKVKGRLYEIDPHLVDTGLQRPLRAASSKKIQSVSKQSTVVRRLLSQLQQITSDALFDEREADAQWPATRNKIAQNQAARREQGKTEVTTHKASQDAPAVETVGFLFAKDSPANDAASDCSEEPALLGAMFSAISNDSVEQQLPNETNTKSVVLRDFGKVSGVTPRKLLEEVVRSKDPNARLDYQMVSPTTYSCRHSVTITWSKHTDFFYDNEIAGIICSMHKLQARFEATNVATTSVGQSESFISTAALFSLAVTSPKEERIYLRLANNWRELYREFLGHRKARMDSTDREAIRHYRSIIQAQIEADESDGVVLTSRFKLRNQAAMSSSTSNSGYSTPVRQPECLRDIWAHKVSTPAYQHMLVGRANLPVFGFRDAILSTIDRSQVTIICGETGCGKSTQIPSFILEHELSQGKSCKVFCTQPRRISAISLAQRVSQELGEGLKDIGTQRSLVGYAIRLESKTSSQTRLVYATVGIVLRMLESSGGLQDITHLIIDEVHERSIDSDFLLIILRSLMGRRPDLKVILMSATVDAARFSTYLSGAPILTVPGRTYPVQTQYLEDVIELTRYTSTSGMLHQLNTSDNDDDEIITDMSGIHSKLPGYSSDTRNVLSTYNEYATDYDLTVRLIETVAYDPRLSPFSSAILVFLPGIAEIRQLNSLLVGHPSFSAKWSIYPLHSTISSEEQQAAFILPPPGVRKIVLATNIAETGVTIPDITCVIDTGKHKEMRFDERRQLSRLTQSFISRANAKQRRGRAGRVQEGICFHLYTKYRHDNLMTEQQTPEMLRLSLQDLVMRTKICKLGDIEATLAQALDPPSSRNVRRAVDALIEADALTPGEDLTHLGRQIAKLPLDAHLGKLVLLASTFACVDVAITIAAVLSSKSPFLSPFGAKQRADAAHLAFKKGNSDLLTAYHAYKSWRLVCTTPGRSEMQFCQKNFLSPQSLGNIEDLKAQLLSSLVEAGFLQLSPDERRTLNRYRSSPRHRQFVQVPLQYDTNSDNDVLVNTVIATAFYPKILIREGKGWRNIANNQTVSLAPTSVNKGTAAAQFLSYYHIMQSSNKYYNAHSTSMAQAVPIVLMAAADMDFKLHAGVISLPGNVLRFSVQEGRAAVALKVLRHRIKEILANSWKSPARQLSERELKWLSLVYRVFGDRFGKDEKMRERAGNHGK